MQLNGATQKQAYKFKYFGVAFTSDGRQNEELDIRFGKAIAIMRTLHYSVVVKRKLSKKRKAINFRSSLCPFSPAVSLYGHGNLVITERVRSQVQASKIRFLQKMKGVTLLTRCPSHEIRKSLKPLRLQIKRSQLRWFGHVRRMPREKLFNKLYLPKQMGKKTAGRSGTTVDESILH